MDLPESHFRRLVKKHGFPSISRSLTALHVLNKNRNKKLSRWADKMQETLAKFKRGGKLVYKRKPRRLNPCPAKEVKRNPVSKAYPYRIYIYKLGKSKASKGGRYIKDIKRTNLTLNLKPSFNKKEVLDALREHKLLTNNLDNKLFDIMADKSIFYVKYRKTPEFELRREDI